MLTQSNLFSYYIRSHEFLFRKPPPPLNKFTPLETIFEIQDENLPPETVTNLDKDRRDGMTEQERQQQKCYKKYLQYFSGIWSLAFQSNKVRQQPLGKQGLEKWISHVKGWVKKGKPMLPPQQIGKKTLVLELDETLISTTFQKPPRYDFKTQFLMHGRLINCYSIKRFGLESFLYEMNKIYELVVFTSTHTEYANKVLEKIDPEGRISYLLNRENCIRTKGNPFTKSLKGMGRNDNSVIIVDSNPCTQSHNPHNCYRIEPFLGKEGDKKLLRLQEFLRFAYQRDRITPIAVLRKGFESMQINRTIDYAESKVEKMSLSMESSRYSTYQMRSSVDEENFTGEFDLEGGVTGNNLVKTW